MYIVYNTNDNLDQLRSKYLVLELDTLDINGKLIETFAVIDNSLIPLVEINKIVEYRDLHENLIKNYRLRNWSFCEQAISHLIGCFKGEMDSFYSELAQRISDLQEATLAEDWTGNIIARNN